MGGGVRVQDGVELRGEGQKRYPEPQRREGRVGVVLAEDPREAKSQLQVKSLQQRHQQQPLRTLVRECTGTGTDSGTDTSTRNT